MDTPGMDYETLTGTRSQERIDAENLNTLTLCHYIQGGLTAYAGRCLKAKRNYIFILVIAALNCTFVMRLGTILGVFTFVVLMRPTVKALFPK